MLLRTVDEKGVVWDFARTKLKTKKNHNTLGGGGGYKYTNMYNGQMLSTVYVI